MDKKDFGATPGEAVGNGLFLIAIGVGLMFGALVWFGIGPAAFDSAPVNTIEYR